MNHSRSRTGRYFTRPAASTVLLACIGLLAPHNIIVGRAQTTPQQAPAKPTPAAGEAPATPIPADQLDSLVAPIALYPDPLLSQTLVASTYPLEIVQLQQWLAKNQALKDKALKDKALADAAMKQPWDASIQSMVALPDVVKRLADDIQWTTDLGNAFLAQQSDVMDAVQRMRKKAQGTGALASNEQQKVETKVVENKTVVIVEQTNPQVVYVPSYSPVVVYGPPVYPYPPIYYPYYPPGAVIATSMISFGVGIAIGAAWGGGGWGYHPGWGGNNININVNNNYINHYNRNNNINRGGNNNWSHNAQHRGGAPYGNRATADKFGGTARGDSLSARQPSARTQGGGAANRPQATSNRSPSAGASSASRSGGNSSSVGNRQVPKSSSAGNRSAFGGSSGGGSAARSSSSRGASSMGGSRGGGGRRR